MRSLFATLLTTVAAMLAVAAPASAVETGINETMQTTLPLGSTSQQLGADWVRIWGTWELGEPQPGQVSQAYVDWLAERVNDAEARGIKTLVVIARSPAWGSSGGGMAPPTDPARYAAY